MKINSVYVSWDKIEIGTDEGDIGISTEDIPWEKRKDIRLYMTYEDCETYLGDSCWWEKGYGKSALCEVSENKPGCYICGRCGFKGGFYGGKGDYDIRRVLIDREIYPYDIPLKNYGLGSNSISLNFSRGSRPIKIISSIKEECIKKIDEKNKPNEKIEYILDVYYPGFNEKITLPCNVDKLYDKNV